MIYDIIIRRTARLVFNLYGSNKGHSFYFIVTITGGRGCHDGDGILFKLDMVNKEDESHVNRNKT